MKEITTVGLDLACLSTLPPCAVAMEACGGGHFWGREIGKLGHEVRLLPPADVKPFVRRGKTDSAEAICMAVVQPSMRFVPVKTPQQQAVLMQHRVRGFLVRQQTQLANAIRAHLGEYGIVVTKGMHHIGKLPGQRPPAQSCLSS